MRMRIRIRLLDADPDPAFLCGSGSSPSGTVFLIDFAIHFFCGTHSLFDVFRRGVLACRSAGGTGLWEWTAGWPAVAAHQGAGRAGAGAHGETDAGQVDISLLIYLVMDSRVSSCCSSSPGSRSSRSRSSWRNRRRTGEYFYTYLLGDGQQGEQLLQQLTREQVEQEQELMEKQTQDRWIFPYLPTYVLGDELPVSRSVFLVLCSIPPFWLQNFFPLGRSNHLSCVFCNLSWSLSRFLLEIRIRIRILLPASKNSKKNLDTVLFCDLVWTFYLWIMM